VRDPPHGAGLRALRLQNSGAWNWSRKDLLLLCALCPGKRCAGSHRPRI